MSFMKGMNTLSLDPFPSDGTRFWLTFIPGTGERPTGEIIADRWTFLRASNEFVVRNGFG